MRSSARVRNAAGLAQLSPGGLGCGGRLTEAAASWVHAFRRSEILGCGRQTTV